MRPFLRLSARFVASFEAVLLMFHFAFKNKTENELGRVRARQC